jgi:hypothetical protein
MKRRHFFKGIIGLAAVTCAPPVVAALATPEVMNFKTLPENMKEEYLREFIGAYLSSFKDNLPKDESVTGIANILKTQIEVEWMKHIDTVRFDLVDVPGRDAIVVTISNYRKVMSFSQQIVVRRKWLEDTRIWKEMVQQDIHLKEGYKLRVDMRISSFLKPNHGICDWYFTSWSAHTPMPESQNVNAYDFGHRGTTTVLHKDPMVYLH